MVVTQLALLCALLPGLMAADGFFTSVGKSITREISAVKDPIEKGLVYVGSSQCSSVKRLVGVSYEQIEGEREPDVNALTLEYRDQEVRVIFNITTASSRLVKSPEYGKKHKLYIFIHGFTDDPTKSSFLNISNALLATGECNVLALDSSSMIKWLYLRSSTYVRFIGQKLGEVLFSMVEDGVDPASIHIIGHSLGAHISGFTGKTFSNLTGGVKLGRISGLDPAGPCFSNVDENLRLKKTDADFVDVMHTDAGVYGLKDQLGHIDYYPNKGAEQPNCLFQTCSHSRAWLYYSESVINNLAFPAVRCRSWGTFKKNQCNSTDISYMGFPSKKSDAHGKYELQTNDEAPYGRGLNGTKYDNKQAVVKDIGDYTKKLLTG